MLSLCFNYYDTARTHPLRQSILYPSRKDVLLIAPNLEPRDTHTRSNFQTKGGPSAARGSLFRRAQFPCALSWAASSSDYIYVSVLRAARTLDWTRPRIGVCE